MNVNNCNVCTHPSNLHFHRSDWITNQSPSPLSKMNSAHLNHRHIHNKYFNNNKKRSYDDIWDTENHHPFQIPELKKPKLHGLEFNEYPEKYSEQNSKNASNFACKNNSSKSKKRTFATVERQWNAFENDNKNENEIEIDFNMHLNDPRPMKKYRILSKSNETLKESNNNSNETLVSTILETKDERNMEIVEYNDLFLTNLFSFQPRNDRFLNDVSLFFMVNILSILNFM